MKTVKIVYQSYDKADDEKSYKRTVSIALEDKDADKLLSITTPFNRVVNNTADSDRLYTSLWALEHLLGRIMVCACMVLQIYEEDAKS